MNFIKRAWLATKAKKSRTALLTLVTSSILIFVLAGLTIKSAADKAVDNAKKEAGATVNLQVSRDYMMKKAQQSSSSQSNNNQPPKFEMTPISLSTAQTVAKMVGVKSYLYTSTTTASAGSITPISTSFSSSNSSDSNSKTNNSEGPSGQNSKMDSGDFTITGVNTSANVSDFSSGTNKITKGKGITSQTADNDVVIESDLAKANNLAVGDRFTVKVTTDSSNTAKTYTLKVIGIYKSSSSVTSSQLQNNASNPSNNLYVNLKTANTMKGQTNTVDAATYTLSNPASMKSFVKKAKSKIDTQKFTIESNDQVYQQMLTPLNNVASFSKNIVLLVALAGAVILTLIIILSIRERRYEIGVLMSLGENRLKIIGQFFAELFMVTLVSLVIAIVAGNFVGNAVGNQLLSQQTTSSQQSRQMDAGPGQNGSKTNGQKSNQPPSRGGLGAMMGTSQANVAQINKLNVKQTPESIAKLGAIALLITFLSIILASIGIIRMKPKDILSSN
ncbi:putative ABC transporter permease [Streptococcus mutans SA38]|uniref:ABC transporter permease n=1 Tax=Streptococcus mutans TaxID=1309 RepID=UPI0002B5586B|nr:ABC transporter permease [Streptococcus mutans]EMC48630.1 putative ABC transporter permease [Streptococcus mutans SA38]